MSVVTSRWKAHDVEADSVQEATSEVAGRAAQVRERLRRRAWVFDDPPSYTAGVEEALQALTEPSSPRRAPVSPPSLSMSSGLRSHTA